MIPKYILLWLLHFLQVFYVYSYTAAHLKYIWTKYTAQKINGMLFSQSIASGQLNFLDIDLFS